MSNETPATPAATPATPAAPAAPATPATPAAPATPPATPASPQTPPASGEPPKPAAEAKPWSVPEAYKDKPWVSKIKSEEDLYKQIDGLTAAVGKKTLTIDYANSTPEEIAAHHASLAPKEVAEYGFDKVEGINVERMTEIAPLFQKHGLTAHQAQNLAKDYAKIEEKVMAEATSEEGWRAEMTKSFGEKFEPMVANVAQAFKANLSPEDQTKIDLMPNEYIGTVFRLTQKLTDAHKAEVAALKKQYGAEENGDAHLNKGGNIAPPDITKVRADIKAQLEAMDARPHTEAEKKALVDKLYATYK